MRSSAGPLVLGRPRAAARAPARGRRVSASGERRDALGLLPAALSLRLRLLLLLLLLRLLLVLLLGCCCCQTLSNGAIQSVGTPLWMTKK